MNKPIKTIILTLTLILSSSLCISGRNPQHKTPVYKPYYAQNGSYRGQISERTYRPKNVHVRGYQKKEGTRVRGHYRSRRK